MDRTDKCRCSGALIGFRQIIFDWCYRRKYPLASTGYYLFLPSGSGDTYQVVGIYDVENSSGTYSYSSAGANATAYIDDIYGGSLETIMSFSTTNSGIYYETSAAYSAYQSGNFQMFSAQVPNSIAGKRMTCTVQMVFYLLQILARSLLMLQLRGDLHSDR